MISNPIQKVTDKLQYRAIGIIYGFYKPFDEDVLTKGNLIDNSGTVLDSVVLGKTLPLIKKYIDLKKEYFWVVYPRNKNLDNLHLQIAGIWDPQNFNNAQKDPLKKPKDLLNELELEDNFFSIRGQLIFVNIPKKEIIIKICPTLKTNKLKNKSFKITVRGEIPLKFVHSFVSLETIRKGNTLFLVNFEVIENKLSKKI